MPGTDGLFLCIISSNFPSNVPSSKVGRGCGSDRFGNHDGSSQNTGAERCTDAPGFYACAPPMTSSSSSSGPSSHHHHYHNKPGALLSSRHFYLTSLSHTPCEVSTILIFTDRLSNQGDQVAGDPGFETAPNHSAGPTRLSAFLGIT